MCIQHNLSFCLTELKSSCWWSFGLHYRPPPHFLQEPPTRSVSSAETKPAQQKKKEISKSSFKIYLKFLDVDFVTKARYKENCQINQRIGKIAYPENIFSYLRNFFFIHSYNHIILLICPGKYFGIYNYSYFYIFFSFTSIVHFLSRRFINLPTSISETSNSFSLLPIFFVIMTLQKLV